MSKYVERPVSAVLPVAHSLQDWFVARQMRCLLCGRVRREKSTLQSVDFVVQYPLSRVWAVVQDFCSENGFVLEGKIKKGYMLRFFIGSVPYNIYNASVDWWGAMSLYRTGNFYFNIQVRALAKSLGLRLSQYGLFFQGELMGGISEEQIFAALGLPYWEPRSRNFGVGGTLFDD